MQCALVIGSGVWPQEIFPPENQSGGSFDENLRSCKANGGWLATSSTPWISPCLKSLLLCIHVANTGMWLWACKTKHIAILALIIMHVQNWYFSRSLFIINYIAIATLYPLPIAIPIWFIYIYIYIAERSIKFLSFTGLITNSDYNLCYGKLIAS